MDGQDPVAECRQALLELSDGLWSAASALRWGAHPGDFAGKMVKLGPLFEQAGSAMKNLPVRHPLS